MHHNVLLLVALTVCLRVSDLSVYYNISIGVSNGRWNACILSLLQCLRTNAQLPAAARERSSRSSVERTRESDGNRASSEPVYQCTTVLGREYSDAAMTLLHLKNLKWPEACLMK